MAHTDACKIQVTEFVRKLTGKGMSVREACREAERESDGIPAETIRYWWQQIQTETKKIVGENSPTPPTPSIPSEIPEKQSKQAFSGPADYPAPPTAPGPGRPAKYEKEPESNVPTPPIPPEITEEPMKKPVRSEQGRFAGGTASGPGRPPKPPRVNTILYI